MKKSYQASRQTFTAPNRQAVAATISPRRLIAGVIVIILLSCAAYIPSLHGDFVWDDDVSLTGNPLIHASDGLFKFWFTTEPLDYFPLTYTNLWLEWRLWGMNPLGYRLINLLLHALNGLLVWRVLYLLEVPGAFWVGLIFALHPVNVASVAWITERKNTLSMLLYLISSVLFFRSETSRRASIYLLSLAAFVLAALSKTSVVMLPVVLLLCLWWRSTRIEFRDLIRTAPFWIVSLVLGLVTIWFQTHRAMHVDVISARGPLERLLGATWAVWFYLIKAIAPFKLSAIYQPWRIDVANFLSCVPGLALLIVLGTALYFRRTWGRGVFFALAYAAVTLFPVLGFFPMAFAHLSLVADHWQYLSILGPIALLVGIIERSFGNNRIGKVRASTIACAALASLLLVGTWNRAAAYNGAESLWSATLAANPQAWGAHYNLGLVLAKKNQTDLAENHFRQALDIDPSFAEAHYNLGILLLSQGRIPEAISHLEKSANLKKDFSDAHYGLAVAYSRLNLTELAVKQLHETVRLRPDYAEAYYQLGVGLESQEKSEEAADSLTHAVALRPDYPEAQFLLGQILARQGRTGAAVEHYVSALRSKADFADAHTRLAACLAEQGKSEESLRHYLEAIRLNPRDLEAQNNAAWLLATHPDDHIRDGQKALELARSAVELAQGKVPTVLGTLAAAYAEAGRFAEAIQSAQVALRLAQKTADTATIHELKAQLLAYQQHKPYRQSPRT